MQEDKKSGTDDQTQADEVDFKIHVMPKKVRPGEVVRFTAEYNPKLEHAEQLLFNWNVVNAAGEILMEENGGRAYQYIMPSGMDSAEKFTVTCEVISKVAAKYRKGFKKAHSDFYAYVQEGINPDGKMPVIDRIYNVKLNRASIDPGTSKCVDLARRIRHIIQQGSISYIHYKKKMDGELGINGNEKLSRANMDSYMGLTSYGDMKNATRQFLLDELNPKSSPNVINTTPYLDGLRGEVNKGSDSDTVAVSRLRISPELIWAYWMESGYLMQTMNAICLRFQNKRLPYGYEALANLDLDPLRPLNNLLWGYIQDDQFRQMFPRRMYEYDHQLGMRLKGRAVPKIDAVDSRAAFPSSFSNLLRLCAKYYADTANMTIMPDGFAMLNALRDMHMVVSEGAGNQFGDMAWTARQEFLMVQYMLARPEIREFLRGRITVLYPEDWMGAVDAMKRIQGWSDASVRHNRDLAYHGEQLILSIRHYRWDTENSEDEARAWAEEHRSEIQSYIQSYRAVRGVDLSATNVTSHKELVAMAAIERGL